MYMYDFTDLDKKIIIEYNGSHVHASEKNKNTYKNPYDNNETWETRLEKDNNKRNVAEEQNFKVIVVWDYQTFNEKIQTIKKALYE